MQPFSGNRKNKKGFAIIDVLIAIAIISVALITFLEVGLLYVNSSISLEKKSKALLLLKKNIEVVRNFRDGTDWSVNGIGTFSTGSSFPYRSVLNTGTNPATVSIVAGEETIGVYTIKIIIDKVSRDPATRYIEDPYNPANNDENTRKITSMAQWEGNILQLSAYFVNWK